jgi:hypothetical protein
MSLARYLHSHHETLNADLRALWEANGARLQGSWTEVFGGSPRTDEIFMAWQYGSYVQAVAAAGKSAYDLPMYANAWLADATTPPGNYPSGGPLARVIDIWKAAGSSLDMLSPDLYDSDVAGWSARYHRADNPLFLPETNSGHAGAAAIFYILGEHASIGFSPFGIDAGLHGEQERDASRIEGQTDLTESYTALTEIMPALLQAQTTSDVHGFLLSQAQPSVDFLMHGVTVHVSLDELFGHRAQSGYGLLLQESPGHFLGAGRGFRVSFEPQDRQAPQLGLAAIDEGRFRDGRWIAGRRLNGDEDDQGNYWRFDSRSVHIERASLYTQR